MECLSDCRFLKLKHEGTLNTLFLSLEMTVYQVNPILCQCWQPPDTVMVLSKSNPWQTTGLRMNCSLVDCQVVLTQNTTVVPQYLTNNDRIYPSTFLHDSWDSELRAMENIWNHVSLVLHVCTVHLLTGRQRFDSLLSTPWRSTRLLRMSSQPARQEGDVDMNITDGHEIDRVVMVPVKIVSLTVLRYRDGMWQCSDLKCPSACLIHSKSGPSYVAWKNWQHKW